MLNIKCDHEFGDMISTAHYGWPGAHKKTKRCGQCGLSEVMHDYLKTQKINPVSSDSGVSEPPGMGSLEHYKDGTPSREWSGTDTPETTSDSGEKPDEPQNPYNN